MQENEELNNRTEEKGEEEEEEMTPVEVQSDEKVLLLAKWKERSSRLENLVSEQKNRIQKLSETESKLTRLLQLAKRSLNNKDATIEKLNMSNEIAKKAGEQSTNSKLSLRGYVDGAGGGVDMEPRRILYQIVETTATADLNIWCLVEYTDDGENNNNSNSTQDPQNRLGWHLFHSRSELQEYVARKVCGEPVLLPPPSLTPQEAQKLREETKEEIDRVQEEFRRYRVRAEITRKQKDVEIKKANSNSVQRHQSRINSNDLVSELEACRLQLKRYAKLNQTFEENDWQEKYDKLKKENERLRTAQGQTGLAQEWRERYENLLVEKDQLVSLLNKNSKQKFTSSTINSKIMEMINENENEDDADTKLSPLEKLKREYDLYRQKASAALEEKENQLQLSLQQNNGSSNMNGSFKLRRMSSSSSSLGGMLEASQATTNEYLKNIILKYMTADQPEAKEHMEKAIATVLHFTNKEIHDIQEKRKQSLWSLW